MQYALYAAGEALSDAGWQPQTEQDHETTVRFPTHSPMVGFLVSDTEIFYRVSV